MTTKTPAIIASIGNQKYLLKNLEQAQTMLSLLAEVTEIDRVYGKDSGYLYYPVEYANDLTISIEEVKMADSREAAEAAAKAERKQ